MRWADAASTLLLQSHTPVTVVPPTAHHPLLVAFTGTSTAGDVYDDVRFFARPWPPDEANEELVHGGFADRTLRLCTPELLDTLAEHPDAVLAGHSAGGACAVLLAAWAAERTPSVRHSVYTFGAPRVGNKGFAAAYRRRGLWDRTWRHRTPCDPVPRIPPWLRHVGVEVVVPAATRNMITQHSLGTYNGA